MKRISSDDLQSSSQLSINPIKNIDRDYEEAICDFDLSQKYQRQPSSQKKRIFLSIVFIALLFLICYLTFKISIDMPNYLSKYEAAGQGAQFKKINHQIQADPQTQVKQKIILLANAAQQLQKKFVFTGPSNKLGSVSISKSLQQVKNIKDSIKRIQSKVNIQQKITKNRQILSKTHVFDIPKIIWVYQQQHKTYVNKLCRDNIKFYGQASGYEIRSINQTSYSKHFSIQTNLHLGKALDHVSKIRETNPSADNLKKMVILYNALYQYGGIIVNGPFAFTQNLQWITNVSNNILRLRGDQGIVPQIIAFYKPNNSPPKKSYNIEPFQGMEEVDKFVTEIPAIQQFFMASIQKAQFISDFLNKLYDILNNIQFILHEKTEYGLVYDKNEQLTKQIVYTASQIVLKRKQEEIDELVLDGYKKFAFDYYGIAFINANYGPYKLDMVYGNFWLPKVPQVSYHSSYYDLARYKYQDFLAYTGPIKYLCRLNNLDRMEVYLKNSANGNDIQIFQGSLIQKLLFPNITSLKFIVRNPEKSFTNLTNDSWDTLPKIIWIYWADGIENASPFHQMCYENIKRTANLTGFQVIQINNDNLNKYIPQKQIERMQATFQNAKTLLRIQSISDVYRLGVLYLHGGIYFDITSVGVQSYDWITNIGKFPSQLIFNRFGTNPKVLMTWHPYDAQPGGWQYKSINKKQSVKAQWHLALQNSFIVAQKQSEFIKEWMDLMMEFIQSPYDKIQSAFIESGVNEMRWTLSDNHYLLAMDTAKCVLGRRQKKIEKQLNSKWINAADYYKLWSFSAYLAPTKMRSNLNYDDPGQKINAYIFRYPIEYMQEIIGQTRFYIKFFGYEVTQIKKFINEHPTGNFTNDTHSRSFFRKYMWDEKFAPMIAADIKQNALAK